MRVLISLFYSVEIIYIMAIRSNNLSFLTPDRRPEPDTVIKGFSTTAARGVFKNFGSPEQRHYQMSKIKERICEIDSSYGDKLNWFQSRAAELREYLKECPKIEKRKIREIFNWQEEGIQEQNEQRKLLKELGQKVRGLIKQNNKLKHTIYSGEITELRIENERLKFLLESIHKGQTSRNKIIIEQNELMKNFIQRQSLQKIEDRMNQNSTFNLQRIYNNEEQKLFEEVQQLQQAKEKDKQKQPLFNTTPLSTERLKNLKQYLTMYVNTAIQQNDQRFNYQQKYIDALEKRLIQLQKINQKLQHFTFQKRVKLQQSQRKTKNFTAKAPKVNGDNKQDEKICYQNDQKQSGVLRKSQILLPINYYKKKQRTTQAVYNQQELQEQVQKLRSENGLLKFELSNLKQKYEVQIEKHLRDITDKQKLASQLQKLAFESKQRQGTTQYKGLD